MSNLFISSSKPRVRILSWRFVSLVGLLLTLASLVLLKSADEKLDIALVPEAAVGGGFRSSYTLPVGYDLLFVPPTSLAYDGASPPRLRVADTTIPLRSAAFGLGGPVVTETEVIFQHPIEGAIGVRMIVPLVPRQRVLFGLACLAVVLVLARQGLLRPAWRSFLAVSLLLASTRGQGVALMAALAPSRSALREGGRALIIVGGVFAGSVLAYETLDKATLLAAETDDISTAVVFEQLRRSQRLGPTSTLLIGDSSCLMGVNAVRLERLTAAPVQSLCSIGFLGPRGYARLLENYLKRNPPPDRLIIMMHGISFERAPDWEVWENFVESDGASALGQRSALERVRIVTRLVLAPPLAHLFGGRWGRYFGDPDAFFNELESGNGTTIDPQAGLRMRGIEAFKHAIWPEVPLAAPFGFTRNERFDRAMSSLAEQVARIGPERTLLVISPIPAPYFHGAAVAGREAAARELRQALAIPESAVLATAASAPYAHFLENDHPPSGIPTHLNRWGRELFTDHLADLLSGRPRSPS
jgi:hypothetical protein